MADGGVVLYTEGNPSLLLLRLSLANHGWPPRSRWRMAAPGEVPDLVVLVNPTEEREELLWNRCRETGAKFCSWEE